MPPDLTTQTRPLQQDDDTRSPPLQPQPQPPPSSCGGLQQVVGVGTTAAAAAITTTTTTATDGRVTSVSGSRVVAPPVGTNRSAAAAAAATSGGQVVRNTYLLSPKLREAFAPLGATSNHYTFREVLLMLKAYLFSNSRLFDPIDRNYINCKNDPLEKALGVSRFHFTDVRNLVAQNIIVVGCTSGPPNVVPDRNVSQSVGGGSNGNASRLSTVPPPPGSTNTVYLPTLSGGRHSSLTVNTNQGGTVTYSTNNTNQTYQGVAASSGGTIESGPQPGPSAQTSTYRASPIISCPEIPDSCSEAETEYSVQGYETEFCRNTEYYSTDEDECMTREEQEEWDRPGEASTSRILQHDDDDDRNNIASTGGVFMEVEYDVISDNEEERKVFSDSDSSAGVVGLVLATCSVKEHREEVNGGFCPDADSDTDNEVSDGYQLSDDNASERWDCLECGIKNRPFVRYCAKCWQMRKNWLPDRPAKKKRKPRPKKKNQKGKALKMASSSQSEQPMTSASSKTSEQDATIASESASKDTIDDSSHTASTSPASTISTQDSGISSQDMLDSQDVRLVTVQVNTSSSRKRLCSEQSTSSKRLKVTESDCDEPSKGVDALAMELCAFITSSEGKAWLGTSEGARNALAIKSSLAYQNVKTKQITEYVSPEASTQLSLMCSVCFARPKNASIIHGRVSHQATCYPCAKRLHSIGAKCPVCRRKIHMVCKQIIA